MMQQIGGSSDEDSDTTTCTQHILSHQMFRYLNYLTLTLCKIAISQRLFNLIQKSVCIKFHQDVYFAARCLEKLYFPCVSDLFPSSAYNNYVTG